MKRVKINIYKIAATLYGWVSSKQHREHYENTLLDNMEQIRNLVPADMLPRVLEFFLTGKLSMVDIWEGIYTPAERALISTPTGKTDPYFLKEEESIPYATHR